jgi:hypothetical protein
LTARRRPFFYFEKNKKLLPKKRSKSRSQSNVQKQAKISKLPSIIGKSKS